MINEETIAAISTAPGTGGIGIIRISGDKAFEIAGKIFKGRKNFDQIKTHTINHGRIINPGTGETVDEALVSKMKKPGTFTREDIVEINCHGGMAVLREILEIVVREGARPAEPGEFTKRAFLNGRIDLSQAEAVIDLINSKTNESSKAAMEQLEGKLSKKLKEARGRLIGLLAHIDVTVDYPEHDIEEITGQKTYCEAKEVKDSLNGLLKGFEKGRIIRESISAVIVGRPNVGKSSLLNELTGKNRAIVTDIPGTTRDIIEEYIDINGIPVCITDTAGLRETGNIVEKIGVEKAERAMDSADLVIMMVDAVEGLDEKDLKILERIKDKKAVLLINKIDIADKTAVEDIKRNLEGRKAVKAKVIKASVKEGIGMEELEKEITELFLKGEIKPGDEILITSIRHKNLVDKAIQSIDEACSAHASGMPLDCIAIDIKNAAEYLGQITGESVSEDVLKQIFDRFCVGK